MDKPSLWNTCMAVTSSADCPLHLIKNVSIEKKSFFFLFILVTKIEKSEKNVSKNVLFLWHAVQKWILGVPCKSFILPILVEKTIKNTQKNVYFSCYFSIEFNILSRKNRHGLMGHPLVPAQEKHIYDSKNDIFQKFIFCHGNLR